MESDTVNQIKSAYPLDDIVQRIIDNANKGKLVVLNESKAKDMLVTIGVQPSEVPNILNLAKNSLSQPNSESNTSTQKNQSRDADYLSAVNRGDMETAQRMVEEAAKAAVYRQGVFLRSLL